MTKLAFVLDNGRELQVPLVANMPLGRLAEVTAAVQDAELLHQERLQSLGLISARHEHVSTELAEASNRYHQVSAEVHRLQAVEAELRHELQTLAVRREQSLTTLQELSGRRAVDEELLKSLEERTVCANQRQREAADAAESARLNLLTISEELAQARHQQAQIHADIAERTCEMTGLSSAIESKRQEAHQASLQLSTLTTQIESRQRQLVETKQRLTAVQEEHVRLTEEVNAQHDTIETQQKKLEATRLEQEAADNRLAALCENEAKVKNSVESLEAAEKSQRERYDELHSLSVAADNEHAIRMKRHEAEFESTSQKLQEMESRLEALEAWNDRMNECQTRLKALPPESLEARNLRNDIDVSMAGLRHLLSKHAQPVAPPPLLPPTQPQSQPARRSGILSADGAVDCRPHPQPSELTMSGHGRLLPQAGFTSREADRQLEDKIRQNEARLELLERRLKRGELEERRQREKISSLKQQLGEVAGDISGRALVGHEHS